MSPVEQKPFRDINMRLAQQQSLTHSQLCYHTIYGPQDNRVAPGNQCACNVTCAQASRYIASRSYRNTLLLWIMHMAFACTTILAQFYNAITPHECERKLAWFQIDERTALRLTQTNDDEDKSL